MSLQIENGILIKYTDTPGLVNLTLPDEVRIVERKAFDGCAELKTVTGLNVASIGRVWGDHEISRARRDLCLVFPKTDIAREPAYTFKMALCLGFLRHPSFYETTFRSYENYALVQKKWLLKSLISTNCDELLLKALEFYAGKQALGSAQTEELISFAAENGKTLSSAVLINFRHSLFQEKEGVFDEFEL